MHGTTTAPTSTRGSPRTRGESQLDALALGEHCEAAPLELLALLAAGIERGIRVVQVREHDAQAAAEQGSSRSIVSTINGWPMLCTGRPGSSSIE